MRYTHRITGVALGAVLFVLMLAVVGLCTLISTPALALTAEQEQAIIDYAAQMSALNDESSVGVEMYIPSISAYVICDYSTIYSLSDAETLGSMLSDIIHSSFTEVTLPARLNDFSEMGIDEINIIGITYSEEGHIIYLSINGTDMSNLANFA